MNKNAASDADEKMIAAMQSFIANRLAVQPDPKLVLKNDFVKIDNPANPKGPKVSADYIPISVVQTKLDEIYDGLWKTENFITRIVANEEVGQIDLVVFHPIAKVWLTRTGAAAVMVQMKSQQSGGDGDITNIRNKIINTMVKDHPHLLSACIMNAAKSLGVIFGRDLNRKFADTYFPYYLEAERLTGDLAIITELLEQRSVDEKFRLMAMQVVETKDKARIQKLISFLNDQPKKTDLLLKAMEEDPDLPEPTDDLFTPKKERKARS